MAEKRKAPKPSPSAPPPPSAPSGPPPSPSEADAKPAGSTGPRTKKTVKPGAAPPPSNRAADEPPAQQVRAAKKRSVKLRSGRDARPIRSALDEFFASFAKGFIERLRRDGRKIKTLAEQSRRERSRPATGEATVFSAWLAAFLTGLAAVWGAIHYARSEPAAPPAQDAPAAPLAAPPAASSDPATQRIQKRIVELIANNLGVPTARVTMDARLIDDLGADSLDLVELVMMVEKEFNVEIPDQQAEKLATLRQFVDYVKAAGSLSNPAPPRA